MKIEPTCRKIEEMGYKWTNMENSVHNFYFEWESDNKDIRSQKRIKQ